MSNPIPVPIVTAMLQLIEFIPVLAFFIAYAMNGHSLEMGNFHYHFDGIYSATAVLMGTSVALLPVIGLWKRKLEKRLLWIVGVTLTMGSATLFFHNPRFIQWKFTVIYWIFSAIVLGSHLLTDKNIMQRIFGQQLSVPDPVAQRLTWIWGGYFFVVGGLNLFVAYHFSESTWVSYKLWSSMCYTLLISIITALIVAPHLNPENKTGSLASKPESPQDQTR
jgi:intracellular septation protein